MRIAAAVLILLTSSALADEVTLQTPTGTLYGTLLTPSSATPVPVVLIIAGSGPTDRDGNSILLPGPNNSLRMLAEGLVARGIASLRYDKRAVAASIGARRRPSRSTLTSQMPRNGCSNCARMRGFPQSPSLVTVRDL